MKREQPASSPVASAKPAPKSDALADRLRTLRQQAEDRPPAPHRAPPPADTPAPRLHDGSAASPSRPDTAPHAVDVDELLETDDGFLEDLLRGEEADAARLSLDARAELDTLRELARQFSELATVRGEEDGDDSGGEEMRRDVEDVLSKALADAESSGAGEAGEATDGPGVEPDAQADDHPDAEDKDDPALSLPSVPTDLPSPTQPPQNLPSTGSFDDDMARRMAALKNFNPQQQPPSDSLDLPSVPTFHPADKSPPERPKPAGRVGFTDDDAKTWCVVCLEDGTLICPGCEDDVYCSRCWYEMHQGPAAGFDERGHEALRFDRDQKKKKVAVGA